MLSTSGSWQALGGEVMTVTDPTELNRLMALASGEGEALAALDGCVDRLHQVQLARAALARLGAFSLHTVLQARRDALVERDAQ